MQKIYIALNDIFSLIGKDMRIEFKGRGENEFHTYSGRIKEIKIASPVISFFLDKTNLTSSEPGWDFLELVSLQFYPYGHRMSVQALISKKGNNDNIEKWCVDTVIGLFPAIVKIETA